MAVEANAGRCICFSLHLPQSAESSAFIVGLNIACVFGALPGEVGGVAESADSLTRSIAIRWFPDATTRKS